MRWFLAILILVSAPVRAEWVKYTESVAATFYYDPATTKTQGHVVHVWTINNLRERDKAGHLSVRALLEHDCREERYRHLSISSHSERMAGGETILAGEVAGYRWVHIAPGTTGAILRKLICP